MKATSDEPAARLRWSKFFWQDWAGSSELRLVSPAARGVWMDLLATIAQSGQDGSKTFTIGQVAALVGVAPGEAKPLLDELAREKVGEFKWVGASVVVTSRRMAREAAKRRVDRVRQQRHRGGTKSGDGGSVSDHVTTCHAQKSGQSLPLYIGGSPTAVSHASATPPSRGEARGQRPEEDSYRSSPACEHPARATPNPEGASLVQPQVPRPKTEPTRPASTWREAPTEQPRAFSLGSLLAVLVAPPRQEPPPRAAERDEQARPVPPFAIRDPVALARYAQQRGAVKPGRCALLRAIAAAVHAIREGLKPAALFWHLLRQPPETWCRARDDDDAARLLKTYRGAFA